MPRKRTRQQRPKSKQSLYAHERAKRSRAQNRRTATPSERAKKARVLSAFADEVVSSSGPVGIPINLVTTLIGIALIPLVWVTMETFLSALRQATVHHDFWRTPQFWFFNIGILLWAVVLVGLRGPKMIWMYVFGHEYTHAAFTILSFGKVLKLPVVTSRGGEVVASKNNILISLSPYLVPFYSVIAALIYWTLHLFMEIGPMHERFFFGVIGFTWAFHMTFTFLMVIRSQPDLENYGVFFSLVFIVLINVLIIATLFVIGSPTVDWRGFAVEWWGNIAEFAGKIWGGVTWFFGEIAGAIESTRD